MTVRYITVTPVSKLFKPATRSFGDIAIVGAADNDAVGPMKTPIPITNPDSLTYSAKTTLVNAVTTTDTSLTVPQAIVGFPSGVPFSIKIENEILSVTAVNANTWTVTRA
jgi:phosphohistidine swiveling domain-containing protein